MKYIALIFLFFYSTAALFAQADDMFNVCSKQHIVVNSSLQKTSVLSAEEDRYDVQYVKLDISLTNTSVYISGNATTVAKVLTDGMDAYVFELSDSLQVDSVLINGFAAFVTHTNGICKAYPVVLLNKGQVFTAKVYYRGMPKTGNGFFDQSGMNSRIVDEWNTNVTYTLSEPYASSDWWPCKQSLKDKIDSIDVWVTVPDSLKAGSNGALKKTTTLIGGLLRYEWHSNYAIDYYLISVAVGKYLDYSYKVLLPGTTDSMPVQNYVYSTTGALDFFKAGLDSTANMLTYFSGIFGTYPFYKEKYGHCLVPLFGGMEHQTMTTCGGAGGSLLSHELAHQWFGDHVTCATWRDIWLNEGFASYAEYLFLKQYRGDSIAENRMSIFHKRLLPPNEPGGSIYVTDTTSFDQIFSNRLSYAKAAAVIHTLRFVIDNDSLFFGLLKKYQQIFAFGVASTADFQTLVQLYLGKDLAQFFQQWIYKEGYPIYSAEWNKINGEVFIRLKQATTNPQSVSLFKTPVEIKLLSPDVDSVVRVENNLNEQTFRITTNKNISGIAIDPNNKILNEDRGSIKNIELGINDIFPGTIKALPNPATNYWTVVGLPPESDMILTDMAGRVLYKDKNGAGTGRIISADGLLKGVYILFLSNGKNKMGYLKLIKL